MVAGSQTQQASECFKKNDPAKTSAGTARDYPFFNHRRPENIELS
jgi:hypothetical protein